MQPCTYLLLVRANIVIKKHDINCVGEFSLITRSFYSKMVATGQKLNARRFYKNIDFN